MRRLCLLLCALSIGCSERELELLAPVVELGMDAGADELDAGSLMDARTAPPDAAATPLDAGRSSLILRYDFAGTGTEIVPRVGSASAFARGGAALDGSGSLQLDGVDDYVDLPNRSLAALTSATLITWVTWSGGVCWQRVFDFGSNDAGEDKQGRNATSLFVTFSSCPAATLLAMYERQGVQAGAESTISLAAGRPLQLALAFEGQAQRMRLYLDGERVAEAAVGLPLSMLADDNAWLGRSQWIQDGFAHARYDELRLYDRALSDGEVADTYARGADAP